MGPKRNAHWMQFFNKDEEKQAKTAELLDYLIELAGKYPEGLVNASFKGSVLEAKRLLNQNQDLFPYNQKLRNYLRKVQSDMMEENALPDYSCFSIEDRKALVEPYEEGNAYIARHFLGREDGVLFTNRIEDSKDEVRDYTNEEIADVYSRLVVKLLKKIEKLQNKQGVL